MVCERRRQNDEPGPQRPGQLVVLRRYPRRICYPRKPTAGVPRLEIHQGAADGADDASSNKGQPGSLLESVPAPKMVLSAVAPCISHGARGATAERHRQPRRPRDLGAALLELLWRRQRKPITNAAGFRRQETSG